jgi:hypothetical protein
MRNMKVGGKEDGRQIERQDEGKRVHTNQPTKEREKIVKLRVEKREEGGRE